MKNALINYSQNEINDELYTPVEAVEPLIKYLPKDKIYWECTDFGGSNITKVLKKNGFKVIASHIKDGVDFLTTNVDFYYDIIITNPPYSLKTSFLKRAYELQKPFAFLLPITTLEGVERGKLFREFGLQLIVFDRRVNFMKNKKRIWFNTSWFCWRLLENDLIFENIKK